MGWRSCSKREIAFPALLPRIPRNAIFGKNADFGLQASGGAGQRNGKISDPSAKMLANPWNGVFGKNADFC